MLPDEPPQPSASVTAPVALVEAAPAAERPERMNRSAVLWVALAIFAQESVWNFYDAQVPAQLRQFVSSATVIGLIMGLDTGLGVIIQPWTGLISDRLARSRTGRWPIVVAGACVAAVPFALIPWATGLPMLMLCIFAFGLTANSFKGVTETLVSDYVAPQQRGRAQGFIKAGVSLTIIVSALISLLVVDHSLRAAFAIPPVLMVVMVALSYCFLGRRHPTALRREDTGTRTRTDTDTVTTLADGSRLTPRSVAAHTLYENADPFRITEPSGTLDTTDATYEAVDERTVRVRGSRYLEADGYTNKLEGAELVGYQTVIIGGVRDKVVIERLPELLPMAKKYFDAKILDVFDGRVDPDTIDINYRLYGTGTVLAGTEPTPLQPQELGVLITVTAPDQGTAHAISTFVAHASSHLPIPEYDGLVSTLAYPYSPPEIDRGPLYRFTLNHVATGVTPTELFRTTTEEV